MTKHIYTVGQLNRYIYNLFDNEPFLHRVSVTGEVSNLSEPRSGHLYFSLKDQSGKIPVAMFRGSRKGLKDKLRDGMKVVVSGEVTVYPRGGYYQVIASEIEPAGVGDLHEQYEKLKAELAQKGMFDASHKKPIPKYVKRIGVVTARTGAVIRDIIRITKRRNPHVSILLYPVLVQGDGAAQDIAEGLSFLDGLGLDVLIVGRGGGSIEDLWAFNEVIVAQAIYDCETPVVSAVGHETDMTIADFVADKRAATPSEAAELCVFDYEHFMQDLSSVEMQLKRQVERRLSDARRQWNMQADKLSLLHPKKQLERKKEKLAGYAGRLSDDMRHILERKKHRLALSSERLDGASPSRKFKIGFGYPVDKDGKNIKSVSDIPVGDEMITYVSDGRLVSTVTDAIKEGERDGNRE